MRRHVLFIVGILPALALLGGCESSSERQANQAVIAYFAGDYDQSRLLLDPLAKKTDENFVLNNARLGSAAMAENHLDDAETAFLRAYEVINSVGVNNGGRTLGATLIDEKIKVWKGEPFERAMVNFYLGSIYYMHHDYGNARAAYENALFKLRDYGGADKNSSYTEVESNFALAYLMLARSWQQLGEPDKANAMFAQVAKLRPDLAPLADAQYNRDANLVLIVDWGFGPLKRTNADGAVVGFSPTPWEAGPIYLPNIDIDGKHLDTNGIVHPPVDLLALAQDRRWQSIDTIRLIKSISGTGLMAAGAVEAAQGKRGNSELGLGLFLAGLLLKATSQADIRQWEMLPRTVFVIPLKVPPGTHDISVEFTQRASQTLRGITVPEHGEAAYYVRLVPWRYGNYYYAY